MTIGRHRPRSAEKGVAEEPMTGVRVDPRVPHQAESVRAEREGRLEQAQSERLAVRSRDPLRDGEHVVRLCGVSVITVARV